jgi:hypothetical protein
MNIDLNTAATIATLIIITVTAIAAYVQLRHMRTANQLEALLTVLARVEHADFGRMVDSARAELAERLPDPAFRRSLEEGNVARTNNPWLTLGNSYEWVGSLVRAGLVDEDPYMDIYADRVVGAWEITRDAIAIIRRRTGPSVLENFEYLYVRARAYIARHPNGVYPSHTPRAELHDRWAEVDAKLSTPGPKSDMQDRAGTGTQSA